MGCTLFLDFDGVTHPDPCRKSEFFCQLPFIEEIVREHPQVEVVISSSWRYDHSIDELRGFFSSDLRQRVVSMTPSVKRTDDEGWIPRHLLQHHREWECRKWIRANARREDRWIALDDMADWFVPGCPNMLATSSASGFLPAQAATLHQMIIG